MAEFFDVLASEPSLELLSPTETESVVLVTAQAKPSGIVYQARISEAIWNAQGFVSAAADILEGRAVFMNKLAEMPETRGVSMVQDVNNANRLQDTLIITVQSDSGRLTADLPPIPFPTTLASVQGAIEAGAAKLNQLEGT